MTQPEQENSVIQYDDFAKVELKVGTVLEVSEHPNADKLLVLKVDLGEDEPRQILAGLKEYCSPDQLLGTQIVVVANLAPRKMRGLESQGMLLAASWVEGEGDESARKVIPITTSQKAPAGSSIS